MKESDISFPKPGSSKDSGRGTLPNPIGTGIEQLPALGGVAGFGTTLIEVNHYQADVQDNRTSLIFNVNDYTEDRSFIINRGVEIRGAAGDQAAATVTILARFATFGNPLTSVIIVPSPHNPFMTDFNRTVYFSIVTFL